MNVWLEVDVRDSRQAIRWTFVLVAACACSRAGAGTAAGQADALDSADVALVVPAEDATAAPDDLVVADEWDVQGTIDWANSALDAMSAASADATAADACKDLRKRGDNKAPQDRCWEPPRHYCSSPWDETSMYLVCRPPDFAVCCLYPSSCRPCGWTPCVMVAPGSQAPAGKPACPADWMETFGKGNPPECGPYIPDNKATYCWDGFPAEWNGIALHANDDP